MRPYRGLRKDNGEWVYGYLSAVKHTHCESPSTELLYIGEDRGSSHFVIPETVGQSTGLLDKNGVELDWWEGDLLRKGSDHPNAPIGIVFYSERLATWVIVGNVDNHVAGRSSEFCGLAEAYSNGWQKIGNIRTTPEKLEKT